MTTNGLVANTPVDTGNVAQGENEFGDEPLSFAGAATYAAGTILARKLVSDTVAVTPGVGNTGTRVLSVTPTPGRSLKVGTYSLVAGTLASGLGPWTLTDPDGISQQITTAGGNAGDDLVFPELGLTVVVADTGTNFVTGDNAALAVAAQSGSPLVPYSATGTNGAQVPKAVLSYAVTSSGVATVGSRPILSGPVDKGRLVVHGVGAPSVAQLDMLRATGIVPINVAQLDRYDNS